MFGILKTHHQQQKSINYVYDDEMVSEKTGSLVNEHKKKQQNLIFLALCFWIIGYRTQMLY